MRSPSTMLEAMMAAAELPENIGIRFHRTLTQTEFLSFADLDRRARNDALRLHAEGMRPGERALLVFDAGMEFVRALYAAFYAGLIVVPVPVTASESADTARARIQAFAADCGSRTALTTSANEGRLHGCDPQIVAYSLDEAPVHAVPAGLEWTPTGTTAENVALILYTSGSTGAPKGVQVSHGNLTANQRSIAAGALLDEGSVLVGWLPHYHDMGLGMFMQAIYCGFQLVFTAPAQFLRRPVTWLRLITTYGATVSVAPDFAYNLCTKLVSDEQLAELDLSTLRTLITGAEPVRAATIDRFVERFAPAGLAPEAFTPAYGMAETTLLVTAKSAGSPIRRVTVDADSLERGLVVPGQGAGARELVSCGVPDAVHEVAIVDPATARRRPPGRVGEIWVSGPSVSQGYWGQAEITSLSFGARLDGDARPYLRTGDLGFLDDGELVVTGRLKDLIIVRGRNIEPTDIERVCSRELGTPDDCAQTAFEWGDHGVAVVAETDAGSLARAVERIDATREHLSRQFSVQPLSLVLVRRGAVPRTTSGKVQRRATRALLSAGALPMLRVAGPHAVDPVGPAPLHQVAR
ncbi:fatty acyl-AMP ligase [Cellulomonas sp. URHD0024]|uniref:fatty acyl-AMP ligase n=1 Tax=Cellulomonas sp. URHD0024 TaxID=1302620 RepID=UPI0003F627A1|nr:fatty acyl-AMP ligase [Cellulomonas sp. URHD0024]